MYITPLLSTYTAEGFFSCPAPLPGPLPPATVIPDVAPCVHFWMRWFHWSHTYKLPLSSTNTNVGRENLAASTPGTILPATMVAPFFQPVVKAARAELLCSQFTVLNLTEVFTERSSPPMQVGPFTLATGIGFTRRVILAVLIQPFFKVVLTVYLVVFNGAANTESLLIVRSPAAGLQVNAPAESALALIPVPVPSQNAVWSALMETGEATRICTNAEPVAHPLNAYACTAYCPVTVVLMTESRLVPVSKNFWIRLFLASAIYKPPDKSSASAAGRFSWFFPEPALPISLPATVTPNESYAAHRCMRLFPLSAI